jgi:hypothetical protein
VKNEVKEKWRHLVAPKPAKANRLADGSLQPDRLAKVLRALADRDFYTTGRRNSGAK